MDGQWSDPFDHGAEEVDAMWRQRLTHGSPLLTGIADICPEIVHIAKAAELAHSDLDEDAESQRRLAGYGRRRA